MATLPTYQRRVSVDATNPALAGVDNSVSAGLNSIAGGISDVGTALVRQQRVADEILQRKKTEDAHAWTANALSNDHVQWSDWMAKAQEEAPPGAPNFAGQFMQEFDKNTGQALANAPDEQSKMFYGQRRAALRADLYEHARGFEAQQGIKYRDEQWDNSIDNVARVAARDPDQGKTAAAELEAILRASPNAGLAQLKIDKLRDSTAKAATQGLIERNPELALRTLDSYFGVSAAPVPAAAAAVPPAAGASAGGAQWDVVNAATAAAAANPARMAILEAEAGDPNLSGDARASVRREIKRLQTAQAKMPMPSVPSVEPPPLKDGKPQSGNWYVDQLDPQTAWTMRNRAQADMHRLAAEARAQAQDNERIAGVQVKSVIEMMKDGYAPSDQVLATTARMAAGTQFEQPLSEARQTFGVTSAFRVMPDRERQAMLDTIRASGNAAKWTPREAELFDTLSQLDGKIRQSYRDDPLRAGVVQGLYPALTPIDTSSIGAITQSMPARLQQAGAVSARLGKAVSPFTGEEASSISSMLAPLAPREASIAVESMARAAGPYGKAIAAQLDGKDKALSLAFDMGSQMSAGSTDSLHTPPRFVSEMVLKGARAEKDGTSTKGEKTPGIKASTWKAALTTELEGVLPAQDASDKVRDAALYVAHAIASEQGGELSKDDLERAARLVVGGQIIDHNGRRVALPGGMSESDLDTRLRKVSVADIAQQTPDSQVIAGGVPMTAEAFVKTLPGQQLIAYRPGQYGVLVGGRPVITTAGRPVLIGVQ